MSTEAKHEKWLALEKMKLAEVEQLLTTNNQDDVALAYEKIGDSIKRLELSKDETLQYLIDSDQSLENIREWSEKHKDSITVFRKVRDSCKTRLDELQRQQREEKLQRELEDQRRINDEQTKFRNQQQKEMEEALRRKQNAEEEWFLRKLELQKQTEGAGTENETTTPKKTQQTVRLQKYTITPFSGDYKDWLRFWNQFTVEVDGSTLSEISKFHYLLELVKDKPRDDILGLPH